MGERDDTLPPEYRPTEEDRKVTSRATVLRHVTDIGSLCMSHLKKKMETCFVESSYVKEQTISTLPEFWEILRLCSPHWFQPLMVGHDSFFFFFFFNTLEFYWQFLSFIILQKMAEAKEKEAAEPKKVKNKIK